MTSHCLRHILSNNLRAWTKKPSWKRDKKLGKLEPLVWSWRMKNDSWTWSTLEQTWAAGLRQRGQVRHQGCYTHEMEAENRKNRRPLSKSHKSIDAPKITATNLRLEPNLRNELNERTKDSTRETRTAHPANKNRLLFKSNKIHTITEVTTLLLIWLLEWKSKFLTHS
jgi:hypothetical protein